MGEVAELFATLGARIDQRQWSNADRRIASAKRSVDELHGAFQDRAGRWRAVSGRYLSVGEKAKLAARGVKGLGDAADGAGRKAAGAGARARDSFGGIATALKGAAVYFGGRALYGGLIKFNATAEESKNQIAGMLALSKKTNLSDELENANTLVANLTKRAASLPGTTADYVAMLGNIAQPVTQAGLGMKDLEDLTVGAVVAAQALREDAGAAARDIGQALRGQAGADDPFIGKLLDSAGFTGQEGRQRFNAKSSKERAQIVKQVINSKQIGQLAKAQGNTFSGVLATLQDSAAQFFGKVGKGLFDSLVESIKSLNEWMAKNEESIQAVGAAITTGLSIAFQGLMVVIDGARTAIGFFIEHSELGKSLLITLGAVITAFGVKAAVAWAMALGPITLVIAAVTGVVYVVRQLLKHPEKVRGAFGAAWSAVKNGASALWSKIKDVGARIKSFFVDDIPNAIRAAFKAAFDFIIEQAKTLPGRIPILGPLGRFLGETAGKAANAITGSQMLEGIDTVRTAPAGPVSRAGGSSIGTVQVGGITVNAPNADARSVGKEVKRVFRDELAAVLRQTQDQVG